jgi:hypothetical protein
VKKPKDERKVLPRMHPEAAMPRYFFNIHDGEDIIDHDGTELLDLARAHSEAVVLAGRSIAEIGSSFWATGHEWRLDVTDERNKVLFTLKFSAER